MGFFRQDNTLYIPRAETSFYQIVADFVGEKGGTEDDYRQLVTQYPLGLMALSAWGQILKVVDGDCEVSDLNLRNQIILDRYKLGEISREGLLKVCQVEVGYVEPSLSWQVKDTTVQ